MKTIGMIIGILISVLSLLLMNELYIYPYFDISFLPNALTYNCLGIGALLGMIIAWANTTTV